MQRVIVYIDGFNLYYGLRAAGLQRYYWLNLRRLAENLLRPGQTLAAARYFSARVLPDSTNPNKPARQQTYLDALETLPDLRIHYGYFLPKPRSCAACGAQWTTYEEKMTDVNIAVELLGDAQEDAFDTAVIVSADSDLAGPVRRIRQRHPRKNVVIAFPPKRRSFRLAEEATATFPIWRKTLSDSVFPDRVVKADGHVISRPTGWA